MDRNEVDAYAEERRRMVDEQNAARGIRDGRVLSAFRSVPRHLFVPTGKRSEAYEDHPIPVGSGQTISQPYIVAYMTEELGVEADSVVLEVGTGSGYQAAILGLLAEEVHTIEAVEVLYKRSKRLIESLGYGNIHCYLGDGYHGIGGKGEFDRIIITAAAPRIPETLVALLAKDGKMVLPVGSPYGHQELVSVERTENEVRTRALIGVRFVPMTGRIARRRC